MKACNLCGFPVVRVRAGPFGARCIACRSTRIHRAVGMVIGGMNFSAGIKVYELSSGGALCKYLKKKFQDVTLSEFYDTVEPGTFHHGIQCQDVQALTYDNDTFDLVTSTEVFEHIPDDIKGFAEIRRVLRPGGHFIFTVPLSNATMTIERVQHRDGTLIHLLPPEYHNDRIRGKRSVLAWRTYGRDIQQKLESLGFSAAILTIEDQRHAITDAKVIVCKKE